MFLLLLLTVIQCSVVTLNGGYLTITAAVTNTQIDMEVTYDANVAWLGIIFSTDQVSADMHVLSVNSSNPGNPVAVLDCNLDQNSYIQRDDVNNIQPSITGRTSNVNNGLYVAYNRDLATGDTKDRIFYFDQIINICFVSSIAAFRGGGYEQNMPKVCSFFTLHRNVFASQDRLLGNFAGTATLNSNNFTVYAAQSTMYYSVEPWLFLTILNQQQGLSQFSPKWIGISYRRNMTNSDMALVEYFRDVNIYDIYSTGHTAPLNDTDFAPFDGQGANDIIKINGGYDATKYFIGSYCRKYSTGDTNRDEDLTGGQNTFCFAAGESNKLNRSTSHHIGMTCLNFSLLALHQYTFRDPLKNNSNGVINYTEPTNNVNVITGSYRLILALIIMLLFLP